MCTNLRTLHQVGISLFHEQEDGSFIGFPFNFFVFPAATSQKLIQVIEFFLTCFVFLFFLTNSSKDSCNYRSFPSGALLEFQRLVNSAIMFILFFGRSFLSELFRNYVPNFVGFQDIFRFTISQQ